MSKTREKQIRQLKSAIFLPLVLLVIAWAVFVIIAIFNAMKNGISLPEIMSVVIPLVIFISAAIVCLYIPLFKAYFALLKLPEDTIRRKKTIHCVKVKFLYMGGRRFNYHRVCAVILMDENGQSYTYVLEEIQYRSKESCAPYRAYKGTTVSLICYGDTPYVEQIRG